MRTTRRLLIIVLIAACFGSPAPGPVRNVNAAPGLRPASTAVTMRDEIGSARQARGIVEAFEWAIDRYETAGFALPPTTVTFHRARAKCRDLAGHWTSDGVRDRVDICVAGDQKRRSFLLHELAHAWAGRHLDDDERRAFVARRGLEAWSDLRVEWALRGVEQVAILVAWGLEERCRSLDEFAGMDESSLANEFERLTGRGALCLSEPH